MGVESRCGLLLVLRELLVGSAAQLIVPFSQPLLLEVLPLLLNLTILAFVEPVGCICEPHFLKLWLWPPHASLLMLCMPLVVSLVH